MSPGPGGPRPDGNRVGAADAPPAGAASLISVVMACHNAERYLREAVDSVLGQTYPAVELIVVNDGSTDASREILASYGERITVVDQPNGGPYPARNRGIALAQGDLVAFLDADDYWDASCLEKLARGLEGSGDAALAYCGWQNVGMTRGASKPSVPPDYELQSKLDRFLRGAAPWPIHAALVKRAVLCEADGFRTYLPSCMDYDLWLRLGVTRRIVRVPEVLAFYRHHGGGQITSTQWRQAENCWLVKKRFLQDHPEFVESLGAVRVRELVDGGLLHRGYETYWRRDLVSARRIFHRALHTGHWRVKDLPYLLPALLPERLYVALVRLAERGRAPGVS